MSLIATLTSLIIVVFIIIYLIIKKFNLINEKKRLSADLRTKEGRQDVAIIGIFLIVLHFLVKLADKLVSKLRIGEKNGR